MYQLYYWPTPNGHKITIALEELGQPYQLLPLDIGRGEQFAPAYRQISPSSKMPALVDLNPADGGEPLSLFESGAILLYLAQRHGQSQQEFDVAAAPAGAFRIADRDGGINRQHHGKGGKASQQRADEDDVEAKQGRARGLVDHDVFRPAIRFRN